MTSFFDQFFKNKPNDKKAPIHYQNEQPPKMDPVKIKAYIFGQVQGVGFRYTTEMLAEKVDVNGIVENEADGSVYVEAVGSQENIEKFLEGLAVGPSPSAYVERVEVTYDDGIKDYTSFGTTY